MIEVEERKQQTCRSELVPEVVLLHRYFITIFLGQFERASDDIASYVIKQKRRTDKCTVSHIYVYSLLQQLQHKSSA